MRRQTSGQDFAEHEHAGWETRATRYDDHLGGSTWTLFEPGLLFCDLNADGRLDIVGIARMADHEGINTGAMYFWPGGPTLTGALQPTATLSVPGASDGDQLGAGIFSNGWQRRSPLLARQPFNKKIKEAIRIGLHRHPGVGLDPVDAGHLEAVGQFIVVLDHVVAVADRLTAGELAAGLDVDPHVLGADERRIDRHPHRREARANPGGTTSAPSSWLTRGFLYWDTDLHRSTLVFQQ